MGLFSKIKKIIGVIFDKTAWIKSLNFNFGNTTELAIFQDSLITAYKNGNRSITSEQMYNLENNAWINAALQVAPNNLIIRQKCLIDIYKAAPINTYVIFDQLKKLSYKTDNQLKIWAEGYSYWRYTRDALDIWVDLFSDPDIISIINSIDMGFLHTSYDRKGVLYPAPFGDLRDIPLVNDLQTGHISGNEIISNVCLSKDNNTITYVIAGKPVGLNTHIPKDDYSTTILDGIPQGFKFYEGYDKKYSNTAEEIADTLNPKRLASI